MKEFDVKNKLHLLSRASFGINATSFSQLKSLSLATIQQQIMSDATTPIQTLAVVGSDVAADYRDAVLKRNQPLTSGERREINRQNTLKLQDLTLLWMNQMVNGADQLREKMALFWHGHFACRIQNVYQQQLLLDIVRRNALGNFGDLLREVSKSAAMLSFLNNQQNKKAHPNENFAREVMELFTLGRGNYTETDVKQGARAFTGWMYDKNSLFHFNPKVHDTGIKTFLGHTGNFNGDDVLNILLSKKDCAQFITRKIYRYFVNDTPDETHIAQLANLFYQSNYNIGELMSQIFKASWFYDNRNIDNIIKSPVQLVISIQRNLPMYIENQRVLLLFNNVLGQRLFYPPNVAGWPGGTSWIDSSSLMLRLKIPQLIQDDNLFNITAKADDDIQMGGGKISEVREAVHIKKGKFKGGYNVNAVINWDKYLALFDQVTQPDLYGKISEILLASNEPLILKDAIKTKEREDSRQDYIKSVTIALMSTPEFQLC